MRNIFPKVQSELPPAQLCAIPTCHKQSGWRAQHLPVYICFSVRFREQLRSRLSISSSPSVIRRHSQVMPSSPSSLTSFVAEKKGWCELLNNEFKCLTLWNSQYSVSVSWSQIILHDHRQNHKPDYFFLQTVPISVSCIDWDAISNTSASLLEWYFIIASNPFFHLLLLKR